MVKSRNCASDALVSKKENEIAKISRTTKMGVNVGGIYVGTKLSSKGPCHRAPCMYVK
jgi:hypothetical protein